MKRESYYKQKNKRKSKNTPAKTELKGPYPN